jgi:hypothetical protein
LDSQTNTTIRTNTGATPLTNATFNQDGSVTFLNTITALIGSFLTSITTPLINATTGAITTLNSTTVNGTTVNSTTLNNTGTATIGTVNSTVLTNTGLTTTGTLTVNTSASIPTANIPLLTGVTQINAIPIAQYLETIPTGSVFPYAGLAQTIPTGYLLCNGQLVSQTTYSALYALIGNQYSYTGAVVAGQFALPDMRTRAPFGAFGATSFGGYTFQARGISFDVLPFATGPINPATDSPYPQRQCIAVDTIQEGANFAIGQTFSTIPAVGSPEVRTIIGVINSTGASRGSLNVYIILDSPLTLGITLQVFNVIDTGQTANLGQTRDGNLTNQQTNEVGVHTHYANQPGSAVLPSGSGQRVGDPNLVSPYKLVNNLYNGTLTNNSAVQVFPYSMNTQSSAVFMNYIIKY